MTVAITEETICACGCTFADHAGHHDNSIGGDGTYVDLGCTRCGCAEFRPVEETVGDEDDGDAMEANW